MPVRLGTSVTRLEDGEAPQVTFTDGSSGTYDLVVGADGIHSKVRRLAVGGRPAGYVGQASWRFVADGFPELSEWTVMLARGGTFLTVALGQGSSTATPTSARAIRPPLRTGTGASCSPTSPNRSRACSQVPGWRTSRQSRRWHRRPGHRAARSSSATPLTRRSSRGRVSGPRRMASELVRARGRRGGRGSCACGQPVAVEGRQGDRA